MIHVIVAAYNRLIPLRILIDCFKVQTNSNWSLNIIHDGQASEELSEMVMDYRDSRIHFIESPIRNENFGHPNRKTMLEQLQGSNDDFVLITNDDNYYVPTFVELMLSVAKPGVGAITCNTVHSHLGYHAHGSILVKNGIDMGAFIVRMNIAKAVGFPYTDHGADGSYAWDCNLFCYNNNFEIVNLDNLLFIHN